MLVGAKGANQAGRSYIPFRTATRQARTLPTSCPVRSAPPSRRVPRPPSEEVEERLRAVFPHAPTASQEALLHALGRFLVSLIHAAASSSGAMPVRERPPPWRPSCRSCATRRPVELLAPTGRAAQVMGRYAGLQASTIHRRIYLRKATLDGGTSASIAPYTRKGAVFIVDEASMIDATAVFANLAPQEPVSITATSSDLFEFCPQAPGSRIILVGDDAQLPPVGSAISPALDGPRLAREFDLTLAERSLDDVVRQELDSGILTNAHALRQDIALAQDLPEDVKAPLPQFTTSPFPRPEHGDRQ